MTYPIYQLKQKHLCAADSVSRGIVISNGGRAGVMYVEPTAAVPINNLLIAARAEAMAAEEAVLWSLTSTIIDSLEQLRSVLDVIVLLDVICARCGTPK